ncbi:hypothetical protein FA13DRAFT_1744084 [Coprinellus micaceus]|uniref:Secreted protein n=1 Tax=Coprinellus micaceus TaxID=71717 RepID=A0A4Y7SDW0_COPMI|nr:hypothetical protein FA13DRAFT_1744084 [Coprinellus micaceus]
MAVLCLIVVSAPHLVNGTFDTRDMCVSDMSTDSVASPVLLLCTSRSTLDLPLRIRTGPHPPGIARSPLWAI